jgi:hypothetical protein
MNKIIEKAINDANNDNTKLNDKAFEIQGMSGRKNRIFLNSLLSLNNSRYLEIGVWKGSTMYSALFNNNVEYAVGIDNWSEFCGSKEEFVKNMSDIQNKFDFYDEDCFSLDKSKFKNKFNVYFYDGNHDEINQENALLYFYDCLDNEFIYICDDWDFDHVKTGTRSGLKKANIKIYNEWILGEPGVRSDTNGWWCGLYVAYCAKENNK